MRAEYTERESERNTHKDGNMLTQIGPHTPQEKKKKNQDLAVRAEKREGGTHTHTHTF